MGFGFGGGCVLAGLLFGGVGFSISCDSGLWGCSRNIGLPAWVLRCLVGGLVLVVCSLCSVCEVVLLVGVVYGVYVGFPVFL